MTNKEHYNRSIYFFLPIIIAISLIAGMLISNWLSIKQDKKIILSTFTNSKLSQVINYIADEYVDEIDISELTEKAIQELLKSLDPHSVYFGAEEALKMMEELEGEFYGIGVQFNIIRDSIFIVNTIKHGPSYKTGILAGDRIVEIDDNNVTNIEITNSQVMNMLKGERDSFVNIKVFRKGYKNLLSFKIKRGPIPIKSVDAYYIMDDNTGYIKINNFSRATHNQFVDAIIDLKSQTNLKNIIIDLRDNAGGFLNAATNIVDEFLPRSLLLVYTEGQARPRNNIFSTRNRNICKNMNVAVLINEFSASASEIVAGAIQDNDRGFIIGRRSFGKGLVQEAVSFSDGSLIRLTTARYYTPSGRSIQKEYDSDIENYYSDLIRRYEAGEFLEKDSIKLNDSLIFYTLAGRKVYGGGGIMPDIFVPADTIGYTDLLASVRRNSFDYFFSIDYVDKNRKKMNSFNNSTELIKFLDNKNVMNQFLDYLKNEDILIKDDELNISQKHLKNAVYAYIIRQIFGNNEFYKIFNQYNNTVIEAKQVLIKNKTVFDF